MRGIVLSTKELAELDWPSIAAGNGINTIGTHITPSEVLGFLDTDKGRAFTAACRKHGITVEHQLHAMGELLPRELFSEDRPKQVSQVHFPPSGALAPAKTAIASALSPFWCPCTSQNSHRRCTFPLLVPLHRPKQVSQVHFPPSGALAPAKTAIASALGADI